MRHLILAALLSLPAAAHAQITISCASGIGPYSGICPDQTRTPSGDPSLDRAIAICDAHRDRSNYMVVPEPRRWREGYEVCSAVSDAWNQSKAGAELRARKEKEADDRLFLSEFGNHIKSRE